MAIPNNTYPPLFNGQPIFGDLNSFNTQLLDRGRAVDVDTWLGLTPGTTLYGADLSGGQIYGISGAFIASTVAAVGSLEATLLACAEISSNYGFPTGLAWPGNWTTLPNCYFIAAEYLASSAGIVAAPGNQYSLSYLLIIRRNGIIS